MVNNDAYTRYYLLTDGIYLDWKIFVKLLMNHWRKNINYL
jgi:hypothetical protein